MNWVSKCVNGMIMVAIVNSLAACKESTPPSTPSATGAKAGSGKTTVTTKSVPVQFGAAGDSLESLGVTLPSFEELRAKAGQSITADNADAEFDRLQLEAEAEGG